MLQKSDGKAAARPGCPPLPPWGSARSSCRRRGRCSTSSRPRREGAASERESTATAGGEGGQRDDRSVKIKSLEAAKIMKIKQIKWLVLGCIEADFCK